MNVVDGVLDWETVSTKPNAVVLSFAFTPFIEDDDSKDFSDYVADTRYWKFRLDLQPDRDISNETLEWWEKQDKEVRDSQFGPTDDDVDLETFVQEFSDYCQEIGLDRKSQLYCRGASFDYPILADIVSKHSDLDTKFFPVPFWNQNCLRSYIRGAFLDRWSTKVPLPKGTLDGFKHHDPIHDCARAVMHLQYARAYVKGEIEIPEGDDIDPNSNK